MNFVAKLRSFARNICS